MLEARVEERILHPLKDIAHYLGKTVRTVQRWERDLRLPVRRRDKRLRGEVFAFKHEIEGWLVGRSTLRAPAILDSQTFRIMFEAAPPAIIVINDNRDCIDVNSGACQLLGFTRDQMRRLRWDDFSALERELLHTRWAEFLCKGMLEGITRLKGSGGEIVHAQFAARAHFRPGQHLSILWPLPDSSTS